MLVLYSVAFRAEHLSMRTSLGFFVAMVGVILYKTVPKGPPEGEGGMRRYIWRSSQGQPTLAGCRLFATSSILFFVVP